MILALLFAQALPDPNAASSIGWVVVILTGLVVSFSTVWKNLRATPALHRQFVTREEFEKLEGRVDDLRMELLEKLHDNNTAAEDRVKDLHKRIDALPTRIISLLRETKGLL